MRDAVVVMRAATLEDAPGLRPLVGELGYPADPTADRLRRVLGAAHRSFELQGCVVRSTQRAFGRSLDEGGR